MEDEIALHPSKKRAAGRELSRDNPGLDEDDTTELETGTFQKASDEVLASRRIVKVRRQQTTSTLPESTSNPFVGIRLVPPPAASVAAEATTATPVEEAGEEVDKKDGTNTETNNAVVLNDGETENKTDELPTESVLDKEKIDSVDKAQDTNPAEYKEADGSVEKAAESKGNDEKEAVDHAEEKAGEKPVDQQEVESEKARNCEKKDNAKLDTGAAAPFSSFQQLSSTPNAFSGLAGSGFSTSASSFGSIPKDGSSTGSLSSFSFGTSNNGSNLFLGTIAGPDANKTGGSGFPPMQEVQVATGEENEETAFTAESVLFEFLDGSWKERGKGEVKVNVSKTGTQKARLVMRTRGNFRLILNAYIYPEMKFTKMDKRGISFACVNSTSTEGKDVLSTFALKFKEASFVESFSAAIAAHKAEAITTNLKTPDNSPKPSDD